MTISSQAPKLICESDKLLLTPPEAARRLSICERKLWGLTAPRGPIRCVRVGKAVRYSPEDLAAWITSAKVGGMGVEQQSSTA